MEDSEPDVSVLAIKNLVCGLKDLLMKCKAIESDILCMCSHWSTMRQDIIAEFYSMCERRNLKISKCKGVTLVGGLTVVSASLVLTQSFLAFAGTLAVAGAAAISFSKGYHNSKFQNDTKVLMKARDCLERDYKETNGILEKIIEEIDIVNDIDEILSKIYPAKLDKSDLSRKSLLSYEEIIWHIDVFVSGGEESFNDCIKQCIVICRKKLGYLHELEKALGVTTYEPQQLEELKNKMIATQSPWYGTLKEVLPSFLLSSVVSKKQYSSDTDYVVKSNEDSDGFVHVESSSGAVQINASSSEEKDDLNKWLKENAQCLQNTMENILCLLEHMKF